MEPARYLECLDADARRMREVGARDLNAAVPSCPDWSSADLVKHTAQVYLHKVESMRNGAPEGEWPPPGTEDEEPIALFDRSYRDLLGEFAARNPADASPTWYPPDQTVGFWIRRMAQETVIHRVDAELALGESIAPIPDDLAIDGIDEVLVRFLSFATTNWASEFPQLADTDGRAVRIVAGDASWSVRIAPDGVHVGADDAGEAAASVSGEPKDVLLWLWRRSGDDVVTIAGDASLVSKLRDLLGPATQ